MKVQIFDTIGNELKIGDLVQIQSERNGTLTFFARIQIVNNKLFPMPKFSYDRIVKIDSLPEGTKHCPANTETNSPEYWMHPKIELYLIEEKRLDKWRHSILPIENNLFIKFYQ